MAGYGPQMVRTPWGNAEELRERKLPPGPGRTPEQVAQSQRERLYAATVACVARKGYEATTVADLLELSGVSRSAFYQHFTDKEQCMLGTFEAVVAKSEQLVGGKLGGEGPWEERSKGALCSVFEAIADEAAAARLCFSDVYAAGRAGQEAVAKASERFAEKVGEAIAKSGGRELPAPMLGGLLGSVRTIVASHLHRGEQGKLAGVAPELWEWALGYEPPPEPLRREAVRRRRSRNGQPPPYAAYSQAERIIRALAESAAERGYPEVKIAEIAARASISKETFYEHFADKEAALVAALDSSGAQMMAVVLPAGRRAPDWPSGMRAAIGAICAFGAAEPAFARLAAIEVYSAGPAALAQREHTIAKLRALLAPGFELAPEAKPIVAEAVLGAIEGLVYEQIQGEGPESLPQIAPLATYMALAPFMGAQRACEVVNGRGRS